MSTTKKLTIALAGNPNSGKTTIFNNLTGARQHVGNYPGVTVERKEGFLQYDGYEIKVIDLPGTYSLTAFSPDEVIARNVILNEHPDVVVNVVDASNVERNLYLTTQIKELGVPVVIALNMFDVAENQGIKFDTDLLSNLLSMPIVPTVGTKKTGTEAIVKTVIDLHQGDIKLTEKPLNYNANVEKEIAVIQDIIQTDSVPEEYQKLSRWYAVKLLEQDKNVQDLLSVLSNYSQISEQVNSSRANIQDATGDTAELNIIDGRYAYIRGACREALTFTAEERRNATEKVDKVILNRVLALPIFLGIMWLLFQLTFTLATPFQDMIVGWFDSLGEFVGEHMEEGLLSSLIVDGLIGGVGGVLEFLPQIILLFLGISLLEGTGYMARAAFVMDKIMHKVGLHGKSFVPMLTGFGCVIPATMATRTLENEKDRLLTILILPMMSCSAKLPVYVLLIAAFFPVSMSGNILFAIYLTGIIFAIIMAKVFRTWLVPGESEPFVMELPSYKIPTIKSVFLHMWERAWLYLKKAGTIILAASVLFWALLTFPMVNPQGEAYEDKSEQLSNSYAASIGKFIEPAIKPIGLDWKSGIALVAGFTAKEVVVSTMGTIYSMEDSDALAEFENFEDIDEDAKAEIDSFAERAKSLSGYTPLTALILMLFTLLYVPCMAAVAVIKRETNSWKWAWFVVFYTTALAWVVCFIVYRVGLLLGFSG